MPELFMNYAERAAFWFGIAVMALAFAEGFLQLFGVSVTAHTYSAGRLLELAAMLMVFVAAVNLRAIRRQGLGNS